MTFAEKKLYHQIHPIKLAVDISTGFFTTWLLWQHDVRWFLILFLPPSIVTTILLIRFANLERLKNSAFGRYVAKFMTSTMEAVRFSGQIIMWLAAWYHMPLLIGLGLVVIIGGWCYGLFLEN